MSFKSRMRKVLPPLLAIAAGIAVLLALVKTRPEAPKRPRVEQPPLVRVAVARPADRAVRLRAQGTVVPERQVAVKPQVSGRVVWQSRTLVPGGRFEEGETMVRIERRDYELALEQQKAAVSRARVELQLERSRGAVAKREWQLLGDQGSPPEDGDLALRRPQLQAAQSALRSAESGLEQAQLNLSRTSIRAPFNAQVLEESVEDGQLVTSQTVIASLVGTDTYWVQVAMPVEALSWLRFADEKTGPGSPTLVRQDAGAAVIERSGQVLRLLPALDPAGKMARLVVEVPDPLGLETEDPGLPLLLGAFVHVEIEGAKVAGAMEVPRVALREGSRIHVVSPEEKLEIRDVRIAWRDENSVWVSDGLRDGERIVITRIAAPVQGMQLRVEGEPGQDARASARKAGP